MMRLPLALTVLLALCALAEAQTAVPSSGIISVPGAYVLNEHRSSNGANYVLLIAANDVSLDLNGKIVQCTPPNPASQSTFGIIANNVSNVTIKNGWTLGCAQGVSILNSVSPRIENMKIHARARGVLGNDSVYGLVLRWSDIYDIAGSSDQVYAIGVDRPGTHCWIEGNTFRNLHRQVGANPSSPGEGVGVIFSPGSYGCHARGNKHENVNPGNHLEIGYWIGNASVTIERNQMVNIGRGVAVSPGYDLTARDNIFWLRSRQAGSYAIGAQSGIVSGSIFVGYDTAVLGTITQQDNLILP